MKEINSKGMSTIVATLLIVLLTLVVVAILWVVLRNVLVSQSEILDIKKEFFAENVEISSLKIEGGAVSLSLRRSGGEVSVESELKVNEITIRVPSDVISVVDLSGSMVTCKNVNRSCCTSLQGTWQGSGGSPASARNNCTQANVSRGNICTGVTCRGVWLDRLTPTKEANRQLLNIISEVEGSRIGLVAYSNGVLSSASRDLSTNIVQLNNTINSWQAAGGTCICCGINNASRRLQSQSSDDRTKKIIVMSDGEATVGCPEQPGTDPMVDANRSAFDANNTLRNLTIYSIGFGEDVNHTTLKAIADCGNGQNFSALNVEDLMNVYTQVSEEIITKSVISNRFNYLYIVFYNETNDYKERISELPQNLQIKSYSFDLTGKLEGEIVKIEIYPVILLKSGREEIGPLFDSWILSG